MILNSDFEDGLVSFRTSQGLESRATLLRLTRYAASIEVYGPDVVIRASEVLGDFKMFVRDQAVYSGRAIVQHAVNTGTAVVCHIVLDDSAFESGFFTAIGQPGELRQRFGEFLREWQKVCKVQPEFKVAIADIQTFLLECRRWLEQVELGIRSSATSDRARQERAVVDELSPEVIPVIQTLFERFEILAATLSDEARAAHRNYIQRHLHPIVLCAPFAYRCYQKPLGYAGDYEMVNMMLRDPQEGASLFAKVFNVWLLHQDSALAHRNRTVLLKQRLVEETAAAARTGRKARILSVGCGPAREVQDFLVESGLSDSAQFTLMDFNEETLQHAARALRQKQQEHGRQTSIELVKKSVQQLLKDTVRADGLARGKSYDFIYCAGLFDYLPDRTCRRLMTICYRSLAPNGLLLATNVSPFTPNRGSMELILDWHLIYRDAAHLAALRPEDLPEEAVRIQSDLTGINVFLEVRNTNGN